MKHPRNKKGTVQLWAGMGVILAVAIVSFVVLSILLGAFKTTTVQCSSGHTYNSSADNCYSNTNHSAKSSLSASGNITNYGLRFLSNSTAQLGTAGTILGVSLLLVIIGGIGLAGYGAYQKYR